MGKYKVLVGFTGALVGSKGQVLEISDSSIIGDLLNAKYIEAIESDPEPITKGKTNKVKKTTR